MNRNRFIANEKKERKPFGPCEKCGKVWRENFKCCTEQIKPDKPSNRLPSRGSFAGHQEILDNARAAMDEEPEPYITSLEEPADWRSQ